MSSSSPRPSGHGYRSPARRLRRRSSLMVCLVSLAVFAVACGRASEDDVNSALGITPTATRNAEQIAGATTTAQAQATRIAAGAAGTPASADDAAAQLLANGNVALGQTVFFQNCLSCHGPNAPAGALNVPNDSDLSGGSFVALIRDGTGHPAPPGPFATQRISDDQLRNLYAWLVSVSGQS